MEHVAVQAPQPQQIVQAPPPLQIAEPQQVMPQQPPVSVPIAAPVTPIKPKEVQQEVNLPNISNEQWMSLLMGIDLDVLSAALDGDAEEFTQGIYALALQKNEPVLFQLIDLFKDNDPAALHAQARDVLLVSLRGEWAAGAKLMLGEDGHKQAIELAEKLATEEGLKWLELAHATAVFLEQRRVNLESQGEVVEVVGGVEPSPTLPASVEVEGAQEGNSLVIDDGDDGPLI